MLTFLTLVVVLFVLLSVVGLLGTWAFLGYIKAIDSIEQRYGGFYSIVFGVLAPALVVSIIFAAAAVMSSS